MPREIVRYECVICKNRFGTFAAAQECEDRGYARTYPTGCIFGDHTEGHLYKGITFAVANNHLEGHLNYLSLWACRDNCHGDSLGTHTCGGNLDKPRTANLDPDHPTFKRMVAYLNDAKIPVTVWYEDRAISLEDYNKRWNSK